MTAERDHIVRRMREYFERAVAQLEDERDEYCIQYVEESSHQFMSSQGMLR